MQNTTNNDFIKFIFSSIIKNINDLEPSISFFDNQCEVKIIVNTEDMKKIVQYRGKLYRAVKMILKHYFKKDFFNLTIDVQDGK